MRTSHDAVTAFIEGFELVGPTEGQRYSLIYLDRTDGNTDSERFRLRLHRAQSKAIRLPEVLERELGLYAVRHYRGEIDQDFFIKEELRDLLDFITFTAQQLEENPAYQAAWLSHIQRIMDEEMIAFRIDTKGGVHPRVDAAFTGSYLATIEGLSGDRYRNVLEQFEQSEAALSVLAPDPKHAVRSVFNAVEGLFRLMFDRAQRLGSKEIGENLRPALDVAYEGAARRAAAKIERSFGEWVDAAHFYRHEQGQEEPAQPPIELAILLVSEGTAFLRWLAVLDKAAR